MTVVDVSGSGANGFLQRLLANDINKLTEPGKGLYSCMLNQSGGVIDDLIAYRRTGSDYRLVVNAATRDKDLGWMTAVASDFEVTLKERADALMLAAQGPNTRQVAAPLLPAPLYDSAVEMTSFECVEDDGIFIAATGYTGEDGWEIIADVSIGVELWDKMIAVGVAPCGLGARDTLRLEAGLSLYGQDMDESTSPLVSGLDWTVAWEPADRNFIGRDALQAERLQGNAVKLVGLVLEDRGIMRAGQQLITESGDGVVTSGGFSPTMQRSVALARVPREATGSCQVKIRNDFRPARIVRPPFVRHGRILVDASE